MSDGTYIRSIPEPKYEPGLIYAVFSKEYPRNAVLQVFVIEWNLRIKKWRDPWISDRLYAVVLAVPKGEENYWANRVGDQDEVCVTGRIRVGEEL